MPEALPMTDQEQLTALVYGDTFALYDERSFDEFVAPLYARLRANGIKRSVFDGKRCLDAGCGGGRGSILMAQCGAHEVVGVDLSARNVESCRKRAAQKGLTNLSFSQHSLLNLPFEDESFDVVWCNGVLHHMADPDRGLKEISRVLKTEGYMWLYLYGSGGTYWYIVDWVRTTMARIDARECIAQLQLMDVAVRRIAEWIDDWFTPHLRRYTVVDVTSRLAELGFEDTKPLKFGVGYDTSQRRVHASAEERAHMGEGDVRLFCRKAGPPRGNQFALPDPPGGKGSPYVDAPAVTQFAKLLARLSEGLARLEAKRGHEVAECRTILCRSVHTKVRSLLEAEGPFDAQELHGHLGRLGAVIEQLAS